MEEDKASSSDIYIEMGSKYTHVGSAEDISHKLYTKVRSMSFEQNGSESRRSECCIYRVPRRLRNVNREAYTPLLISIGPLNRENKRLEAMEKEKLKYLKKLTERADGMDEKKICDIVISIKDQEERLRHCYSVLIESSDLVRMILLDAVFIIQFFLESNDDKGPKNFKPRMTFDIREDLILFENQLPLSIIQEIYDRVNRSQDAKVIPFLDLATSHFRKYSFLQGVETRPGVERRDQSRCGDLMLCNTSMDVGKDTSPGETKETRHLTDLLRNLMLSRAIQRSYSPDLVKLKYSAVMLRQAGVRFQVTRDECLVNITFDKGVLKIPHLKVDHNFERLVRNVMAMEECLYEGEAYICSYIKFMDHLIDTAGDVGLLVENGIILHWLGDDAAVSNMINSLCKNIGDNDTCFDDISQELNAHYENRCNHRKATLKLVYFPNIWRGTGTVAAAILLILTLIQTINSFKMVADSIRVQKNGVEDRNSVKEVDHIGWKYPADEWITLNVDGCSKGNPGIAGAGGVLRDHMGSWIGGFARNIGICSSMTTELWVIYEGLLLTWDRGFRKVVLESDSRVAVGFVTGDSVRVDKNYNLIMQIKNMVSREWEVEILHVYREANCVADWLVNFGLTRELLDRGADIIIDPPSGLYSLLYYDLIGSTVPHLI